MDNTTTFSGFGVHEDFSLASAVPAEIRQMTDEALDQAISGGTPISSDLLGERAIRMFGDAQAEELIWKYAKRRGFEHRLDTVRVEEIAGRALARVLRYRHRFDVTQGSWGAWSYRVLINETHRVLGFRETQAEHVPVAASDDEAGDSVTLVSDEVSPDQQLVVAERAHIVRRALDALRQRDREILLSDATGALHDTAFAKPGEDVNAPQVATRIAARKRKALERARSRFRGVVSQDTRLMRQAIELGLVSSPEQPEASRPSALPRAA